MAAEQESIDSHFRNGFLALKEAKLSLAAKCHYQAVVRRSSLSNSTSMLKPKLIAGLAVHKVSRRRILDLNPGSVATLWSEWLPGYGDR